MSSLLQNFQSDESESLKARNLTLARQMAERLFNGKGRLVPKALTAELEDLSYSLSPYHNLDAPMIEWIRAALKELVDNEDLRKLVNGFYKPVNLPYGDELLRYTLGLPPGTIIDDLHAKKAALVCLLTYFRQNVGSCFATAPAIKILSEQRELFLKECLELLSTGKMKRIVEGVEYAVPLSPNWGMGHLNRPLEGGLTWDDKLKASLSQFKGEEFQRHYEEARSSFLASTENALLRSWEYTLASFSEAKAQFIGWNLYHSLGVDVDQPDGIGAACFRFLTEKIEQLKKIIEDYQRHYEGLYFEVKTLEARVGRGSSQNETDWAQLEYRSRINEMEGVLAKRDDAHYKAERFSVLYPKLIETYSELFPLYFQEIYDAGMQVEAKTLFDDSPAGFRLLFKHGRTNPSAWTFIYNGDQFVDALSKFFSMTEMLLFEKEDFQGLEKDLEGLVSEIILMVRSRSFLEHAHKRVAKIHDRGNPWEYVSGGSLIALLTTVYGINFVKEPVKRVMEAPQELLIFMIDTFKDHPPEKSVLASSPTHAFVVRPDFEDFHKSWNNSLFTYTWVRDNILTPRLNFFEMIRLDNYEISFLIERWRAPVKKENLMMINGPLTPFDLMNRVAHILQNPILESHFEAHLYNSLPLFSASQLQARAAKMGSNIESAAEGLLTADDFRKALYQAGGVFKKDPYIEIAVSMEREGFAPPRALVFADTNWHREYFAFHVGLRTGHLELVLSDYTGSSIRPIREWRQYLDGQVKDPWALYL